MNLMQYVLFELQDWQLLFENGTLVSEDHSIDLGDNLPENTPLTFKSVYAGDSKLDELISQCGMTPDSLTLEKAFELAALSS